MACGSYPLELCGHDERAPAEVPSPAEGVRALGRVLDHVDDVAEVDDIGFSSRRIRPEHRIPATAGEALCIEQLDVLAVPAAVIEYANRGVEGWNRTLSWSRLRRQGRIAVRTGVPREFQMAANQTPLVVEEVSDPAELARSKLQDERFERNSAWLQAHFAEVYSRHRGKCICVAGEELFVGDSPEEVFSKAKAAHPEDDGRLLRYIPRQRMSRIYAS